MKQRIFKHLGVWLLCMIALGQTYGQNSPAKPRLNQEMSMAEKAIKENECKLAAKELVNALQTNNLYKSSQFFPSRAVYQDMILAFSYETEEKRSGSLKNFMQYFEQEQNRVYQNMAEAQRMFQGKTLEIVDVQTQFTPGANFAGGRVAVIFNEPDGTEHVLHFYKFYEFNGQWYLTNKLRWN